jgi:hypothetical protein
MALQFGSTCAQYGGPRYGKQRGFRQRGGAAGESRIPAGRTPAKFTRLHRRDHARPAAARPHMDLLDYED